VKTDSNGNALWNKTYGETNWDEAFSMVQTSDGGFALAGRTDMYGPNEKMWLVKTDANGNALWDKEYGGASGNGAYALVQTSDGGYALAGFTSSHGAGKDDMWLVKTDSNGNALWDKTYGGATWDGAYSMVQTSDGGYALAGYTYSYGAGYQDFWLVKTDASGNAQWNKTYGGTYAEEARSIVQTSDGGYALAGWTDSFGAGLSDAYLVKTDASGKAQWSRTYGEANYEQGSSIVETRDGGYALAGDTSVYAGTADAYFVKTEVELGLAWTDSTADTLTLYRGAIDPYWNFVRVRIWKPKTP
jgi:hypothetical protein